jgi:hypothetical protein
MVLRLPRLPIASCLLLVAATACGGDGSTPPPDVPAQDIGFNKPTAALRANTNNMDAGPADLACLGTASPDQATTVDVSLATTVRDFQNDSIVPNAAVTVFRGQDVGQVLDMKMADGAGKVTVTIPTGTKRFGFKMTDPGSLDTLLLNQRVEPGMATQTLGRIQSVSRTTATLLPALINKTRTPGAGVLAGAMSDCGDKALSNFIATVSSTRGTATPLTGADTYYFDPTAGLPVRHSQRGAAAADGLFMVIELPVTATAYVQIWGYPTDADLAADQLKLIAELEAPVIADTVITGSYEPLRAP